MNLNEEPGYKANRSVHAKRVYLLQLQDMTIACSLETGLSPSSHEFILCAEDQVSRLTIMWVSVGLKHSICMHVHDSNPSLRACNHYINIIAN